MAVVDPAAAAGRPRQSSPIAAWNFFGTGMYPTYWATCGCRFAIQVWFSCYPLPDRSSRSCPSVASHSALSLPLIDDSVRAELLRSIDPYRARTWTASNFLAATRGIPKHGLVVASDSGNQPRE